MKYKVIFLFLLLWAGEIPSLLAQEKTMQHPNIIVFLVDDMGWQDTSVSFWDSITAANKKFHTPNMERLAAQSMKFTQAYANSICTPTRVSLMTGMNAAHHKVTNWTMYRNKAVDPKDAVLKEPNWNVNGLSPVKGVPHTVYATTLFQVLKKHGYYTIHCGKAHFGAYQTPGANPENLGADVNIAGSAAGNPASYLGMKDYGNVPGKFKLKAIKGLKQYWNTPTFLSKALTLEAMKAMDTAQMNHKPFFLYMAHYAVHLPYNADPRFIQKYLDKGLNKSEAAYAALIEGMDASLGTLMDYLDKNGLTKNTVIIFMSDNGGLSHPPRTGEMDTQNYPLRYGKGSLYEGGIREPMMVRWPGVTKAGSVANQYVAVWDFFPTILQIAGIQKYKTVQKVDGKSFVPVLKNPDYSDTDRILIWHFPDNWGGDQGVPGYAWTSAIRKGNWKLIYLQKQGELRLYNLKDDIKEQHNLAKKYPDKVKTMARLLTKKLKKAHAQMPIIKATGKRVPWPILNDDRKQKQEPTWQADFNHSDHFDTTKWSKIPRGRSDWNRHMSNFDSLYAIRDGKLILRGIINHSVPDDTARWITGGVYTKGKKAFGFGRLEIRAKFQDAQGAWPAFWMLAENMHWPAGGEIDIMERLNGDSIVYQTVHTNYTLKLKIKNNPLSHITAPINPGQFNTYALAKYPDSLVFFVNGKRTFTYPRIKTEKEGQFPFSEHKHYLLIDMQLGGSWVGKVNPNDLPVEMEIDWVKFYKFKR